VATSSHQNVYVNKTIQLDGKKYVNCEFRNCTFVYSGGESCEFNHNHIVDPKLRLEGAARNTVDFLQAFYHGGMQIGVEEVIAYIRSSGTRGLPIQ
jgi:hypothetical protein